MFILIPKSLILNPTIIGNDLLTYYGMYSLEYKKTDFITCYNIAGELYGNPLRKIKEIKKSTKILSSLFPDQIISYEDKVYKTQLITKQPDTFIMVSDYIVSALISSKYSYYINMFWLYCIILVTTNKNIMYRGSTCTYDYYAQILNTTTKTISNYITNLENLGIIYIFKSNHFNYLPNIIGKYEDKEFIDMWAKSHGYIEQDNKTNKHRSLMAKFNYLSKQVATGNPSPYSREEVAEIRKYVMEHNKYCKAESKIDSAYLDKIKDLSLIDNIKY